ncbi:hypothetical protein ABZY02_34725 [Streptomyces sp. NPDC006649]|uniref:hypothetical protein n=1 Tax=Streptomyces sp. NPDC006649 TaxID=3156896 RepID=UPI0033A8E2E0
MAACAGVLMVGLVLGAVLVAGFLIGWCWVLGGAGGAAAVALMGWAWLARQTWLPRIRRAGRHRLR